MSRMSSEGGSTIVSSVVDVVVVVLSSGGVGSLCGLCSVGIMVETLSCCSVVSIVVGGIEASCSVVCSCVCSGVILVFASYVYPWAASLNAHSVSSIRNNWSSLNSSRKFPIAVVCMLARA